MNQPPPSTPHRSRRFSARDRHDRQPRALPAPLRIDHPLVCGDPPLLIDQPAQLEEALAHCRAAGRFVYDSEFIGEESYFPRLCLVQLATAEKVFVLDTLAVTQLDRLWDLLADESVLKVVHAGQSDLEPVQRLSGRRPAGVFDTQRAAGFAAMPYPVSLQKLAESLLGVRLGKGLTFTRWDRRPLREDQIFYAADDVRLGLALQSELEKLLDARGHRAWALACCQELCAGADGANADETLLARVRGSRLMKEPQTRAVLLELARWRDRAAQAADQPPRTFCPDGILIALAERKPRDAAGLAKIDRLPRPLRESLSGEILEAITRGRQAPAPPAEIADPAEARQRFELEKFWAALQHHCFQRGIDPGLVTSRREAAGWFVQRHAPAAAHPYRSGWRHELLAEVLEQWA